MMLLYDDVTYPGPFGIDLSRKAATPGSKKKQTQNVREYICWPV